MKKVSVLLKILGGLSIIASIVHFLFGLTYLHFFSASLTMGIVPKERMPILTLVMVFSAASSIAILIAGIVAAINSTEPLKADRTVLWACIALALGILSDLFVSIVGYESSLIYTVSGIVVPLLTVLAAYVFYVLAVKGYRLHGQNHVKKNDLSVRKDGSQDETETRAYPRAGVPWVSPASPDVQRALPETEAPVRDMSFIEFRNVTKVYRTGEVETKALAGVDFTVDEGEFVIIAGQSGAGKSTLLNILGGMDTCTSGQIFVDGREVSAFSRKELIAYRRHDIGFVFQFYNLVQNLTATENVELATEITDDPLNIEETIRAVGLQERKDNFPAQLSGGEQQRVAIARALAKNPKLLLCDEPTGALDYQTGKQILKLLQDTCREKKMTVIVITHNLAITPMGDKVIHIKSGKVSGITVNEHPVPVESIEW